MTSRREMISYSVALGGLLVASTVRSANSEVQATQTRYDFAKSGLNLMSPENDPEFGTMIRGGVPSKAGVAVGGGLSRHDEVAVAFRILFNKDLIDRASKLGPIGVAKYFSEIKQKNKQDELYNTEWATRANPLIVSLFGMTNTAPAEGDQTSWCAAFVNFCLYAAGRTGTFSALSGSFRNFGKATSNPEAGDIVVFSAHGERGKKGFGHVGFFVKNEGEKIVVLGGNQGGKSNSTGAVTEIAFPREGTSLVLHSFRKI